LDYVHIYTAFVYGDPDLYGEVFERVSKGAKPTSSTGLVYSNIVFGMNKVIHQNIIGGQDSNNEECLYKSFRRARKALLEFKSSLRPEGLPWWYWILTTVAAYLALNGIWQVERWFSGFCG
jgi:hypothetical protein